jgi:hypothetical protein
VGSLHTRPQREKCFSIKTRSFRNFFAQESTRIVDAPSRPCSDAKQQTKHKKIRAASCSSLGLTAIRKKKSHKDCSTKSSTLVALKKSYLFSFIFKLECNTATLATKTESLGSRRGSFDFCLVWCTNAQIVALSNRGTFYIFRFGKGRAEMKGPVTVSFPPL